MNVSHLSRQDRWDFERRYPRAGDDAAGISAEAINAKVSAAAGLWRAARGEHPVAVRVGVNTGKAFVGDIGSDRRVDYTVLGNTVNVAARLESTVAGPNEIVVGVETARQAGSAYEFEPLGEQKLKGLSKGNTAFRLKLDAAGHAVKPA
jgi:class 3 adenylate cyclase